MVPRINLVPGVYASGYAYHSGHSDNVKFTCYDPRWLLLGTPQHSSNPSSSEISGFRGFFSVGVGFPFFVCSTQTLQDSNQYFSNRYFFRIPKIWWKNVPSLKTPNLQYLFLTPNSFCFRAKTSRILLSVQGVASHVSLQCIVRGSIVYANYSHRLTVKNGMQS